ncbi:GNAT family N-acetyltransferase [Pseudokineococcus basanitobsidens]|uniref:GNAT family N-acetyltransferase n=1 Tax=Pseudokineococcus basanitobsidens TaxID=1926649 RepID=A0ABU8RMV0_9ACTN
MVTTRAARREDADALGEVHVQTWRSAYAGLLPQALLDALSAESSATRWTDLLPCSSPFFCTVAVDPSDRPLGFAYAGPWRGDADDSTAELYSLYVRPDHQGAGAGAVLLERTRDHLRAAGYTHAHAWVLTTNARARTFYEHRGWATDGHTRVETRDDVDLHETRLTCHLAPPQA